MRVVEETPAPRELEARTATEFSDSHRDNFRASALAAKEIEEAIELR
jgi:hypothetical protein